MAHPGKVTYFRTWQNIARREGIEVELLVAVAHCETGYIGGFLPSGREVILFDTYEFSKKTDHIHDQSHPALSTPVRDRNLFKLIRSQERANENEHQLLDRAIELDRVAAHASIMWGLFLIPSKISPYPKDSKTEEGHIEHFIEATKNVGALYYLRDRKWAEFGKRYNPIAMSQDSYDARLRDAYRRFKADRKAMLDSCVHVNTIPNGKGV